MNHSNNSEISNNNCSEQNFRFIEYYSPQHSKNQKVITYCKSRVFYPKKTSTIYETVEIYERKILPHLQTTYIKISTRVLLKTLINIHNDDGIQNIPQIAHFSLKIKKGGNIVQSSGLPNIKLARLRSKELLVFDGHHSLLAYMSAGKNFLDEIPHIIISGKKGFLKNEEILIFWGQHASKIPAKEWKLFVINWQNPKNKQICPRIQHNMGELFDALWKRIAIQLKDSI